MTKKNAARKRKATRSKDSVKLAAEVGTNGREKPLRDFAEGALQHYFKTLNGHRPADLYEMVIGEIELPLLRTVLDYTAGNQTRAAEILGINRGTLRKKLKTHGLADR